ncbi:MAG: ATP phosphoribosyltransferase regulatory subunit [Solobacterium sp.]|nr:ATP phosphoribosyltransferase regulatory subunit [Solobacterium sp.]
MSLETKLNKLFAGYGYQKFRTSKFEEYDLYAENRDFLMSSQLITFTDLDGSLLALKPDITLSIIKSTTQPRRLYYNEKVYRPRDHHFREIPQAGVECIGSVDLYREGEVISLACKALACIEEDYVLSISHAGFLKALMEHLNLSEKYSGFVMEALCGKNTDYIRSLASENILKEEDGELLFNLAEMYVPFGEGIRSLKKRISFAEGKEILSELSDLAAVLDGFGVLDHVYLDFSLKSSMEYYNGVIFQGSVRSIPTYVLSGGRYDSLMKKMAKPFEAIGFAVYMDVVENSRSTSKNYDGDLAVIYTAKDNPKLLAKLIQALASSGLRVNAVRKEEFDGNERWKRVLTLKEARKEAGI